MGRVIAVCISKEKGTQKYRIPEGEFIEEWGIKDDAHAGKWHRQVSLLSYDKIQEFRAKGAEIEDGAFGENLVVEGFDFAKLPVGTKFRCNDVVLEMTSDRQEMPITAARSSRRWATASCRERAFLREFFMEV